ncbi:GNAT family N-acetyltransferase [Fictibacillus phosphorivorans]|uniref:GNAT family N-acetyltransferase n=1 Tax=Fictibacillus phosphorivorans TaxID=1221500 RepID=UPI001293BB61|nr:GNAT family N-acetyltransferase [Fictibacillus phosphorivorans]MQR94542.1 GNAT family N-acetyltransferase [Fictibacillus phosphorivorans]
MPTKLEKKITIRTVRVEDAEAIIQIHLAVISEHDYFIALPSEFKKTTEDHQEWISNILNHERETMLVAEYENNVVGWIVFLSHERMRMHHIGSFAIMLQKEWRNKGIGKLMIHELLSWAEKHPLIEKVTLGTFSTNTRAIELYKKLGFIEEGRKVKEFKFGNGKYVDDVLMYKWVK